MRSRIPFFVFVFFIGFSTLPHFAYATQIPYFGPIVPSLNADCAGSWDGFVQLMNNAIAFALTIVITMVAPIMIAYSGYLFVINPISPSDKGKAKKILQNTVVGIVVALSAWLIVDAVLTTLTTGNTAGGGGGLTAWTNAMFSSSGNQPCILINGEPITSQSGLNNASVQTGVSAGTTATPISFSPSGTGSCQPSVVQQGAAAGGYTLSNAQAQTLACIAQYESSCGSNDQNFDWNKGSSAFGPFQVLLQTNSNCYNNNACDAAVKLPNGTALNCASGFSGGNPISGSSVAQQCVQAAANTDCSSSAAACLVSESNGSFSAWNSSTNDMGCVNQYDTGT